MAKIPELLWQRALIVCGYCSTSDVGQPVDAMLLWCGNVNSMVQTSITRHMLGPPKMVPWQRSGMQHFQACSTVRLPLLWLAWDLGFGDQCIGNRPYRSPPGDLQGLDPILLVRFCRLVLGRGEGGSLYHVATASGEAACMRSLTDQLGAPL
jgi:hypothetical protein